MDNTIKLRGVVAEDFCNYSECSLYLITPFCDFKCEKECGQKMCQNSSLVTDTEIKEYTYESIFNLYKDNSITKAIVIGGLETLNDYSFNEIRGLIDYFRWNNCFDPFILYTGYYPDEIIDKLSCLQKYDNIIVKFGRFKPGDKEHFDNILGINLASSNQWAEKIS